MQMDTIAAVDRLTGEGEVLCFLDLYVEALTLLTHATTVHLREGFVDA